MGRFWVCHVFAGYLFYHITLSGFYFYSPTCLRYKRITLSGLKFFNLKKNYPHSKQPNKHGINN
jgi:hypothetical protein